MDSQRYARRSARIVLADGRDRVLLFRGLVRPEEPELGYVWFTPGGGVEDGETLAEAGARELREETGLAVTADELGEPVAHTFGHVDLTWASGVFRDDFFFHRVAHHDVTTDGFTTLERNFITAHRWWSVAELVASVEPVRPNDLAALLERLLSGRIPVHPIQLPWHH